MSLEINYQNTIIEIQDSGEVVVVDSPQVEVLELAGNVTNIIQYNIGTGTPDYLAIFDSNGLVTDSTIYYDSKNSKYVFKNVGWIKVEDSSTFGGPFIIEGGGGGFSYPGGDIMLTPGIGGSGPGKVIVSYDFYNDVPLGNFYVGATNDYTIFADNTYKKVYLKQRAGIGHSDTVGSDETLYIYDENTQYGQGTVVIGKKNSTYSWLRLDGQLANSWAQIQVGQGIANTNAKLSIHRMGSFNMPINTFRVYSQTINLEHDSTDGIHIISPSPTIYLDDSDNNRSFYFKVSNFILDLIDATDNRNVYRYYSDTDTHIVYGELRVSNVNPYLRLRADSNGYYPTIRFEALGATKNSSISGTGNSGMIYDTWLRHTFRINGVDKFKIEDTKVSSYVDVDLKGRLNVGGATDTDAQIVSESSLDKAARFKKIGGGWNYIEFYSDSTRKAWLGTINDDNKFSINGQIYLDTTTGNVGIGITSPTYKLEVSGTAAIKSGSATGAENATLYINNTGTSANYYVLRAGSGVGDFFYLANTGKVIIGKSSSVSIDDNTINLNRQNSDLVTSKIDFKNNFTISRPANLPTLRVYTEERIEFWNPLTATMFARFNNSNSGDWENLVAGAGIILTSPNGTKYKITVDDLGNLTVNPA